LFKTVEQNNNKVCRDKMDSIMSYCTYGYIAKEERETSLQHFMLYTVYGLLGNTKHAARGEVWGCIIDKEI